MTIGFSPFLTADVDETHNLGAQWPAGGSAPRDRETDTRLELIRRRVVMGFYTSSWIATETARRIVRSQALDDD